MALSTSDDDLIGRISAGDNSALRVLFTRHQLKVFRFIMRIVRQEAVAEELTNEVFLEVWRRADRFKGNSSVSTWMLAIARYKAISVMRKRREEELDEYQTEQIMDLSDNPEETTQKTNKGELMRKCIEELSNEHKEVIDLVYYHGKSVNEIAEITVTSASTVKTRMFYARKRLSELLIEAGIDRGWP